MTTYLDIVGAIPASGSVSKSLTRDALVKRAAYCLDDSEDLRTITVIDPDFGALPLYVMQQRRLFQYDSTDTTTAHDGTTCLVSAEGKRYKIDDFKYPWSVKSKTLTAPPGSPSIGDSYIVAVAATGAWAGKDNQIATYSSRSWLFSASPEGRHVYNEADGAFWYINESGSWIRGPGSLPFASESIPLSALIGCGASLLIRAINQTTNTPPISPSIGDCYIIGSTPTGAWAGNTGKVAICESGTSFTIYTPQDGDRIYDISQSSAFRWNSSLSSWVTDSGSMKRVAHIFTSTGTFSKDSRCIMVEVICIGGSGGTNGGGTGGTTSFGTHMSAPGSSNDATGNPGTGATGGDEQYDGTKGVGPSGASVTIQPLAPFALGKYGRGSYDATNNRGSGSASACRGIFLSSAIGSSESITVGAAGTAGSFGQAGNLGICIIYEWVLT